MVRPKLPDGSRPIIRLGKDLESARRRVEAEVRQLVEGAPSLQEGATRFRDAIPLIMVEIQKEYGTWKDADSIESRLRRAVDLANRTKGSKLQIWELPLERIQGSPKFWQNIIDAAARPKPAGLGLARATVLKLRVTIGQVIGVLVHEEWIEQYNHLQLRVGSGENDAPAKRRAHPTPAEFLRFIEHEEVPLQLRVDEAIRADMASYRAGDRYVITWADLGAADVGDDGKPAPFTRKAVFPNQKAQNSRHAKQKATMTIRHISWRNDEGVLSYIRPLLKELWLLRGQPKGAERVFLTEDGETQTKRTSDARTRRFWYALTMGIHLREGTSEEPEPTPQMAPELWTRHRVQMFLGDDELDRMGYHSSRSDFDTRVNRVVTDEARREGLTQHKSDTSRKHYDEGRHDLHVMPKAAMKATIGKGGDPDPQS